MQWMDREFIKGEELMFKPYKIVVLLLAICMGTYFSTTFSSAATAARTSSTSFQYGAAAFDPKQTYSQFNNDSLKVQEKGDYTIVTWMNDLPSDGQHLYMSVAKKNKWLFRGKEVLHIEDDSYDNSTMITMAENYIFYGNNNNLKVIVVNLDDGKIISDKTLQTWENPSAFSSTYYFPIKTTDRSGVLYKSGEGKYNIYLAGELSKPLTVEDPKDVLNSQLFSKSQNIVLTTKRDRLVISRGWVGSTVFNISKKDMSYDATGKEKVYRSFYFYSNGKFFDYGGNLYDSNSPKTVTIQSFDENFKPISSTVFKVSSEYQNPTVGITTNGNLVHSWSYNSYQNTNSLQVTSFNLGK